MITVFIVTIQYVQFTSVHVQYTVQCTDTVHSERSRGVSATGQFDARDCALIPSKLILKRPFD